MPGKADDTAIGLDEPTIDPFDVWLRFGAWFDSRWLRTWYDRSPITPFDPLDVRVDKILDLDAIAAKGAWSGTLLPPRPMTREELSFEVEEQMTQKERQFILRNLSRVERFADPNDPLEFQTESYAPPTIGDAYAAIEVEPYTPPKMLEEMNLDIVRADLGFRRWITRTIRWERRFGAEVKADIEGALWRYDPDAPKPDADEADTRTAGR